MVRFEALDAWRGICALLVVLFHFCFIFASPLMDARLVANAYLFVDFFFVLSGFVVSHAYRDKLHDAESWVGFVIRRFGRLWPLHAALLAAFVAFIGLANLLPHPDRLALSWGPGEYSAVAIPLHLMLLNAVNLHGMAWNAPSWSIGAEFYTYLFFGAVCLLARGRLALVAGIIALACVVLLACVSPTYMNSTADFGLFRCMAGFFTGVVAYHVHERLAQAPLRPSVRGTLVEGVTVALVVLFVVKAGRGPDAVAAISLSAPAVFAAAVLVFAREAGQVSRLLRGAPFAALGRWSYSIYMGHQIVLMVAVYGVWLANRRFGFGREIHVMIEGHAKTLYDLGGVVPSFALLAVILGVVIALAAFTYSRIEEPARRAFNGYARRREDRIGRAQAPASRA